jgi:hypothetical protein
MGGGSEERMNWRIRIKRWEAAWLAASGLILLVLLARVAYSYAEEFRRAEDLREQIASAFEHSACERLTRVPVAELPEGSDVEAPCLWVVFERRLAHERNRPTQITAADVRAWPLLWPTSYRLDGLWDMFLLALALLPALYGLGLVTEFVVARRRRKASPGRIGEHL